jgi:hypothetical protein
MSKALGHIKAARLDSPRLQRVLAVLSDGRAHTTRSIIRKGHVVAVNACIAELRQLGAVITCIRRAARRTGGWRYLYTLKKAPTPE